MSEENYTPVAGVECEAKHDFESAQYTWGRITPKFIGDTFITFDANGIEKCCRADAFKFRSIKSPREIAIETLSDFLSSNFNKYSDWSQIAAVLYNEGYIKKGDQ